MIFPDNIIPHDDELRLEALHRLHILDTGAEAAFDNVTRIVAQVFNAPMSFISLVDKDQVYYKSQVGPFGRNVVQRRDSLCSYTILGNEPLVIEDASVETSFEDNPYVAASGGLRFYAGAPLTTNDGYRVGTVCIVDTRPRTFSDTDKALLMRFAQLVMHDLEMRYTAMLQAEGEKELAIHQERFELVSKATHDAIWDWNLQTNEIWWNEAFTALFGFVKGEIKHEIEWWSTQIHEGDRDRVVADLQKAIANGQKNWSDEYRFCRKDGSYASVLDRGYALHDESGKAYRMLGSMQDITQRKIAEIAIQDSQQRFQNLVRDATVGIILLMGDEMIVEVVNESYAKLIGRTAEDLYGKKIFDIIPESEAVFRPIINGVRQSGEAYYLYGAPYTVLANGKPIEGFLNLVYQPYCEVDGVVSGVMVLCQDVTDQTRASVKVEDTNRELQFVLDVMPQMVWAAEGDGLTYFFNQVWLQYTGISYKELFGNGWMQVLHPNDLERTRHVWQHAVHTGCTYEIEYRVRRHDGEYRWFLTRGTPMKDNNGKVLKWYGSTTDVQEQKAAGEILKTVTGNTTLGLFMLDNNRNCIYMNEAAEKLTGFTFSEVEGKNLHYQIHHSHPDGRPYALEACPLASALPMGKQARGEEVFVHKSGIFYPVAFMASPIVLNGTALGTVLEVRDLTEEKKQEQERNENEVRFRLIANSLPVVIWTASPEGLLTYISEQWEDEFGNLIDESLGTGWAKFVHPADVDRAATAWAHSLQTGEDYETEFRVNHKSGDYRWLLVRAIPIRSAAGDIVQWYGSNTDIQDKKLFEEQLDKGIKERTRELEQFTYVSHHDLQEPLRKIMLFTTRLKLDDYEKLSATSQKRLDKVTDAAERMRQALTDVLEFASLNREEQFGAVDLREVMASVTSDLELIIQEKQAVLCVDALPTINAVSLQMHQLLYNLINNALKFSKPGEPPKITIRYEAITPLEVQQHSELNAQQHYHLIAVEDNGIGFSNQYSEQIFALFQRLHNKTEYAGTGIGLALVKKVVANHGGKIWAESSEGNGATFNVLLPAG